MTATSNGILDVFEKYESDNGRARLWEPDPGYPLFGLTHHPLAISLAHLQYPDEPLKMNPDCISAFSLQATSTHNGQPLFNNTTISAENIALAQEIMDYYKSLVSSLILSGETVTDWRKHMVRVLNNGDEGRVESSDDWKVLYKLPEFYRQDTQLDSLTENAAPAEPFCIGDQYQEHYNLTAVDIIDGVNRHERQTGTFFLIAKNPQNQILKLDLSGCGGAQMFVRLAMQNEVKFDVKGGTEVEHANGSQTAYYHIRNPKFI